jgi:hypothetical protein
MPYKCTASIVSISISIFVGVSLVLSFVAIFNNIQYGEGQMQNKPNYIVHIKIGSSVPALQSDIQAFYEPDYLPINKTIKGIPINSIVAWINDDESFHTVTSGDIKKGGPNGIFNSGILAPKVNWSWTFENEGNFTYFCTIHPYMNGEIRVAG